MSNNKPSNQEPDEPLTAHNHPDLIAYSKPSMPYVRDKKQRAQIMQKLRDIAKRERKMRRAKKEKLIKQGVIDAVSIVW